MKTLRPLLGLGLFAVATLFVSAKPFEGRITMEMKDGRNTRTINYAVKPDYVRLEMPTDEAGNAVSIINLKAQEMIMLMPRQPMYMVMPLDQTRQQVDRVRERATGTFEKTGETEEILGYRCTKYVYTDREGTTEIWAAAGLGAFVGFGPGGGNPMSGGPKPRARWEEELVRNESFPLRIVARNKRGKERMHMEAVAIDPQALPDSLFQVPEGYQRFDMGGMMKGMMPGMMRP